MILMRDYYDPQTATDCTGEWVGQVSDVRRNFDSYRQYEIWNLILWLMCRVMSTRKQDTRWYLWGM